MAFDFDIRGFADQNDTLGEIKLVPTADRMAGGSGDDTYYVDSRDDRVVEDIGGGDNDLVYSSVTFLLGANIENLTLVGNAKIGGWGNDGANIIKGNDASNTLVGGAGNDTLFGGGGDDRLAGGLDNDTLTGGSGADTFIFDTRLGVNNVDTITDFTVGVDKIGLDTSSPFVKFVGQTELLDSQFSVGGPTAFTPTILYNAQTGDLSYDSDGTGSNKAVVFAHLEAGLNLTAKDFILLA